MADCNNLQDFTPTKGYWLADAAPEFAGLCFDITDPKSFPLNIPREELYCLKDWADRLPIKEIRLRCIHTADPQYGQSFRQMLNILRDCIAKSPASRLPDRWRASPDNCVKGELSKDVLQKRLFFLHIAKTVVNGFLPASAVAAKYGIDKVNVQIWVSIFLTHGEDAFFVKDRRFEPDEEKAIAKKHLSQKRTVAVTCAENLIFCRNRLRHILRRHPSP